MRTLLSIVLHYLATTHTKKFLVVSIIITTFLNVVGVCAMYYVLKYNINSTEDSYDKN